MNFLISNKPDLNIESFSQETGEDIGKRDLNGWSLYSTEQIGFKSSNSFLLTEGYIRNLQLPSGNLEAQYESCSRIIEHSWPVPQHLTGSFSSLKINLDTNEIILCNDLIGIYPLYYLKLGKHFFISNSIIWLGAVSGAKRDETGIFQRSFGPEFCNLGRRTILEGCKRLLPGEWLRFSSSGDLIESKYDNSLYSNLSSPTGKTDFFKEYWTGFKKELEFCLAGKKKVNLALSGGMDSRILLGAIDSRKDLRCLTYGEGDNYEVNIAKRLAKTKGSSFSNFHNPQLNFPGIDQLRDYTFRTEAIHLCSWLEILENVEVNKEVLLIGDISTAVTGRTIRKFNTKAYQRKNFLSHNLFNKKYEFEVNTPASFKAWKNRIRVKFVRYYNQMNIDNLGLEIDLEELRAKFEKDISSLFERIDSHNLPYIELVDELFTWYTHTRFPMGKQILLNRSKFLPFCPALSVQLMRISSNIPPQDRLNLGFVRKLFSRIGELKELGKIPTSQVPLIPLNAPHLMRIPVWGFRKMMDEYLIKKLVKNGDPNRRYRLFKSNNWVDAYQRDDLEEILESYFSSNQLGEAYLNGIKQQAIKRKKLEHWPFANMNIMNAAALNTELDFIHKLQGT